MATTDREKEREAELEGAMYTNCLLLGLDPAVLGSPAALRIGLFRHSNPRLGEQLLLPWDGEERRARTSRCRLLQAMVDVISSNSWLSLALNTMELSQMVTQGMWDRDSVLLQLPHFTKDLARRCQENEAKPIENIFDLAEMSVDKMRGLLQLSNSQQQDIIEFFKRFPNVDMAYEVREGDDIGAGDNVTLQVTLERDMTNLPSEVGPVHAPRFPKPKEEGWWLVIGDW